MVLCGSRSPQEQFDLYRQGRIWRDGAWRIADKKKIVTYRNGIIKKSKHNKIPSEAVDVAPYPIDWQDIGRFKELSSVIMEAAVELGIRLTWGGNFKTFKDYPHFEI
jgi:hypothetical protein